MSVVHLSAAAASAACNGVVDAIDAGSGAGVIKIYDGSMPATPDIAVSTQTLLAQLTFSDPAFEGAVAGVAEADSITDDSAADATGTAAWARVEDSNGDPVMDIDVTATGGGGTLELNTVSLVAGSVVSITAFSVTMPNGTS